ncbi:MAG: hypothetical protein WBH22_26800, partial [Pseudomonas mandelii]|uniref:hypothetical protein n=1 Tax=Pseudomonas mandelii TaxID=75612 RepID=UPI003C777AD2
VPIPLKLKDPTTDTVRIGQILKTTAFSAKLQAKNHEIECPFDCHHGIANTHGNLMLPARNKE